MRFKKGILCFFLFAANPVETLAQSFGEILPAEKIIKLIPDKIRDYYLATEPQSKVIKLGNIQYSMAEKRFTATRNRSIKILLFDYKEAPIMYNQATRKFSDFTTVESDSIILRPVLLADCTGWESYHVHQKNSQILIGICNRYFLTIEGKNVELESLKNIVKLFKVETYPK